MEQVQDLLCQRATPTTVSALLGGMTVFRVPTYQRAFEWGNEQVDAFLDDVRRCWDRRMEGERERHFFGSVVTSPRSPGGLVRPTRDVIDGQQRFATFLLFVASLKQHCLAASIAMKDEAADESSALATMAATLSARFIMSSDLVFLETKDVYPLTLNEADDVLFKRLLRGETVEPKVKSHELLKEAYEACFAMLSERRNETGSVKGEFTALNEFYVSLLEDWEVVHIEAKAPQHASLIFRVLNNRGLPVSDCDLLRATTMERTEQRLEPSERDALAEAWKEIAGISDDPDEILKLSYQARTGNRFNMARTSAEFEAMHFEELQDAKPLGVDKARSLLSRVQTLQKDMLEMKALSDGDVSGGGLALTRVMSERLSFTLGELNQHWILPLVCAARNLKSEELEQLLCVVDRFAFRYGVMARARIGEYDRKIGPFITTLRTEPDQFRLKELEAVLNGLLEKSATDDALTRQLDGLEYEKNKKELKYLLALLEVMSAWYKGPANGRPKVMSPDISLEISSMTLEHISPQNPEDAGVEMLPHLHKLGNLTLLSATENDRAGNKPFDQKKPVLKGSRMLLNTELAENENWGAEQAESRQDELRTQALRVLALTF